MPEVGISHHGACFTFNVEGERASLVGAFVWDKLQAIKHYGTIGAYDIHETGQNLIQLDKEFRSQVLEMAKVMDEPRD